MTNNIFKDLIDLKLTSTSTHKVFSENTRDKAGLKVYRDEISGVIFIKDYFIGVQHYENDPKESVFIYERKIDNDRRVKSLKQFYIDKEILDFGCEYGDFLKSTKDLVISSIGIELTTELVKQIKDMGIRAEKDINLVKDNSLDTIFCFHCLEHVENQRDILNLMYKKLRVGGKIIIEVPHANDFLLHNSKEFMKFSLWSEHLILHTYQSLKLFLEDSSFKDIYIKGIQRFPLSNHLNWLSKGTPAGHKNNFSLILSNDLEDEYCKSIISANMCDTLMAIASK
tara:strand:+ start:238 stop:1086 length:849 start_codon:yes stop_codon:yes gene_type:complete